jgi:hypothetical protein
MSALLTSYDLEYRKCSLDTCFLAKFLQHRCFSRRLGSQYPARTAPLYLQPQDQLQRHRRKLVECDAWQTEAVRSHGNCQSPNCTIHFRVLNQHLEWNLGRERDLSWRSLRGPWLLGPGSKTITGTWNDCWVDDELNTSHGKSNVFASIRIHITSIPFPGDVKIISGLIDGDWLK